MNKVKIWFAKAGELITAYPKPAVIIAFVVGLVVGLIF